MNCNVRHTAALPVGQLSTAALPAGDRAVGSPWDLFNAAKFLGVSLRSVERLAKSGRIKTIKIGGRRMVPDDELRRVASAGC